MISAPGTDLYPDDPDLRCFLCSQPLHDGNPIVNWMGPTSGDGLHVYWHATCVGSFVLRLARDAWQVEHDLTHRST